MLDNYLDNFYFEDSSDDDSVVLDSDQVNENSSDDKNTKKIDASSDSLVNEDADSSNKSASSDSGEVNENSDDKKVEKDLGVSSDASDSSESLEDNVDIEPSEITEVVDDSDNFILPYLIGKKLGMTQLFSNEGTSYPVTIIEAGPCTVLQIKSNKNDGYDSVQLGFSDKKESKTNKALTGHFNKSKASPKSYLKEFRSSAVIENLSLGDVVTVSQFNQGDYVTVTGISKGKGFAGHMKRHGFGGGRASHGKNSVMRKAGSVGAGTSPGRIFPGMKMAGRMGNQKVSVKNLSIVSIDKLKNLIFVSGAVPGANNNIVYLKKS